MHNSYQSGESRRNNYARSHKTNLCKGRRSRAATMRIWAHAALEAIEECAF